MGTVWFVGPPGNPEMTGGSTHMPPGRPKAIDPDAALPVIVEMFWRGGFDGSTLDQLAGELGVTKPSLCRTLGDKEAIFAAALDAYHREHIAPAQLVFDEASSLQEGLFAVLSLFANRTLNDGLPDGCLMGDAGLSGDFSSGPIAATLGALQGQLVGSVHASVERAISSGELESVAEPASVVQYVLGQFSALSAISRTHPSRSELESVVGFMLAGLPWANRPIN